MHIRTRAHGQQQFLNLRSGLPATGLRKPKSPKVLGRVLGRVPGKGRVLGGLMGTVPGGQFCWEKNGTVPSNAPSNPLFTGTLPSTLPGTFGDLGFVSPVAGSPNLNPQHIQSLGPRFFRLFERMFKGTENKTDSPQASFRG